MDTSTSPAESVSWPALKQAVMAYANSDTWRSTWQIINTVVPYVTLWVLMYFSLRVSYWLTLLLAIPTAGFMVRLFIQFHDCGHASFFKSPRANEVWGIISGILTFTAFYQWRREHARHHASAGDLDRRGVGDIWTLTVEEWLALPRWKRFGYRVYRHPIVIFGFGPLYMFLIAHRFAGADPTPKDRRSVLATNLAIAALILAFSLTIGIKAYILIQLPIIWIGGIAGVWLFYIQHQFEGVYWERHEKWDYVSAALKGSSYYRLPKVLQWFSGNIGIHHIHHLNPRIPNYHLQAACDATRQVQVEPVTLLISLKSLGFRLYDEANRRLVGFREAKRAQGGA